ncbi:MAG: response regulator [Bdellovibrio sp.]|nr:response regulator [Bdellovibrio sp.]
MPLKNEDLNLLDHCKQQRAARVNTALAKYGGLVACVTTILDIYFKMPAVVIVGDTLMLLGAATSLYFSRTKSLATWIWLPLYTGMWFSIVTSLAVTGGANSPFFSGYLILIYVAGLVIQTRVRPLYISLFTFANFGIWLFAEMMFPLAFNSQPPSLGFSFLINGVMLAALMICLFEFLKTEKNLAEEIIKRYQELDIAQNNLNREEAANATKTTFLANISHELRTPLGAILGYADLILDKNSDEKECHDFAETIRKNGHQLLHLVDDLLDLTKVEAGKIEVEKIAFNPMQTVTDVMGLLALTAQKKGLELNLVMQCQAPSLISSDPLRLRQILMNVIGNAIKFSDAGRIQVIIKHQPAQDYVCEGFLIFEVQDSGPGLSLPEQERLFKPFTQADASITRKYGGTGLGLNLSRHLARLLGGELELEWSQPGVGTRFSLKLPAKVIDFQKVNPAELAITKPSDFPQIPNRKNILIVEDNPDNQNLISRYLIAAQANIEVASDGLEAIQKVDENNFDLILMDVQMPTLDGLQTTRLLRQKRYSRPIIALTAHAMKEDRERCLEAGFNDYLTKPIDRVLLINKINFHLRQNQYQTSPNLV